MNTNDALSTLTALLVLSCGSTTDGKLSPVDGGSGGDGVVAPDIGDDSAAECVNDPDNPAPPEAVCVRHVTGKVVDEKGQAIDALTVTVCGGVCFFGKSDGAHGGSFDVHVGKLMKPSLYNLIVHGGPDHAGSSNPLPTLGADGNGSMSKPIVVPSYDHTGPALPADGAGGTVSSGAVTLSAPAGTAFSIDPEYIALGAAGRAFKSVAWTTTSDLPPFAAGSNVSLLVALGPFGARACHKVPCPKGDDAKMAVSITNEAGLAPGTAVEILTLGVDLYARPFVAGQMNVVAIGHVSSDGRTIETDGGEGISTLSWIGVRPK